LHLGVHMACVDHRNATGKVNEAPTFNVPELGVLRTFNEKITHHAHAPRGGGEPARMPGGVGLIGFNISHRVHGYLQSIKTKGGMGCHKTQGHRGTGFARPPVPPPFGGVTRSGAGGDSPLTAGNRFESTSSWSPCTC